MIFDDYFRFAEFVGLLDGESVRTLGLRPDDAVSGRFEIDRLEELTNFVRENSAYHIVTETSDSDDFDGGRGCSMDNEVRFVNRLGFFLADGSTADAHLFEWDEPDDVSEFA
ncbi:MAG: hypothetical protein KF873_00010 [Gemmataceae bacterium]|nr:hypothetical protein [Gemmataceae bacterium]